MNSSKNNLQAINERIAQRIYVIRGVKVMIDFERFPPDFMFVLNKNELEILRCQFGTSSWGGIRYSPMAFTEQGVAMLSSVLNSSTAIAVNIEIIRVFSRLKELAMANKEILLKLEDLEQKVGVQQEDINTIFQALKQLLHNPSPPIERIGFKHYD